ncbi:MAG: multicopper oxidase domain-containing protein [Sulfitobacter sp.]
MKRRQFLASTSAAILNAGALSQTPVRRAFAQGQAPQTRLAMPPLLDTRATGRLSLTTTSGSSSFFGGPATPTAGFNQAYLGPTILMHNGDLAAEVQNTLDEPISTHWHGLLAPGEHDGGPILRLHPVAHGSPR